MEARAGVGTNSETDAFAPVGLGAEFMMTDSVSLKAEYQYQWDFDDTEGPNRRGRNYSYYGNRALVGGQYTLPWFGIRLTDDFDVHLRQYRHRNTILPSQDPGTRRRRDTEYTNVFSVVTPSSKSRV